MGFAQQRARIGAAQHPEPSGNRPTVLIGRSCWTSPSALRRAAAYTSCTKRPGTARITRLYAAANTGTYKYLKPRDYLSGHSNFTVTCTVRSFRLGAIDGDRSRKGRRAVAVIRTKLRLNLESTYSSPRQREVSQDLPRQLCFNLLD